MKNLEYVTHSAEMLCGSFRNEWAEINVSSIKSNTTVEVIPFNCKLISLVYSNKNTSTELDFEIYKNGLSSSNKVFTWEIRDAKVAWKTTGLDLITFSPGDRLSFYVKDQGTNATDGFIKMTFETTDNILSDGTSN